MALSGATPLRQIQRLQWKAGKPLAAAADLHSASETAGGCQVDISCRQQADSDTANPVLQAALKGGRVRQGVADTASSDAGANIDSAAPAVGDAAGMPLAATGLAALRQGPVGCSGAEQPPCGNQTNLDVTLSAMEIRTFLVQLGGAAGTPVLGQAGAAALLAEA